MSPFIVDEVADRSHFGIEAGAMSSFGFDSSAAIAHEVKQPLTIILLQAEAAMEWLDGDTPNVAEARRRMERIIAESRRTGSVINNIRSLMRNVAHLHNAVDLNRIVGRTIDRFADQLLRQGVTVDVQLSTKPLMVKADSLLIEQVLANLISNSMDAVKSAIQPNRIIRLRTGLGRDEDPQVLIEDSGTGLCAAERDRVFDPFYTTNKDGTGIGLALCRSIILSHGGHIWATSSSNGGVFAFTLPSVACRSSA